MVVNVSLFGNEAYHNMITRVKDSYAHVLATIEGLKGIKSDGRLIIGLAHTICQYNQGQYKFIEDFARRLGVGVTYAWERHHGYFNNSDGESLSFELPKPEITLNPLSVFKNSFVLNARKKAGCVAGEYSCWVDSKATVYPCLWSIPDKPSYNLRTFGFKITPRYFQNLKPWIKKCEGCWIACQSYEMLMFRPWRLIK